jgi:hypothetical protein
VQPLVEHHLARDGIVANDERLGIVEQDLARHPAKVAEGPLQTFEPSRLPLVPKRGHEAAARVSESRHEQIDAYPLAGDRHEGRAEVDLQLSAGWRLEAHAGPRLGKQITSQISHCPLDRAQTDPDPVLPRQLLAHHVGIASVPAKPLGQPAFQPSKRRRPTPTSVRRPATLP